MNIANSAGAHDHDFEAALVQNQQVSTNDLLRAKSLCETEGVALDRAILRLGLLDETVVLQLLAKVSGLTFLEDLSGVATDNVVLSQLSEVFCAQNQIIPILDNASETLIVCANPFRPGLRDELTFILESEFTYAISDSFSIRRMLETSTSNLRDKVAVVSDEQKTRDIADVGQGALDGPVIRFVRNTLEDAIKLQASDVHFEAMVDGLRIRLRVNGVLQPQPVDGSLNMANILARVKVLAGLNVSERRLPQDGRIGLKTGGRSVDLRVSSIPTTYGESIVCRILDPDALKFGWKQLGFSTDLASKIMACVQRPHGLFLVTGPTGSGKTTTIYTALSHLNRQDRKILTIEDPVEYNMHGIEQVQVHEEIGMTFSKALRAFLRQDPNIIMVGEIRDPETAEIACRAALVGRMIVATLHTNTPEGAFERLQDLGVPKYILKSVLIGALGQKLIIHEKGPRELEAQLVEF
ncbi:GspE/PulE family protein [Pseudophaeobacter sp.]|uniref:GspE/PulE family protein n=1 Tax=Pseudophaeobacter sp. TaxID=1971739 RepID=UPI003296ABC2